MSRLVDISEETSTYKQEKKNLMFTREFLNLPNNHSTASIVFRADVDKEFKDNKLTDTYLNSSFQISDCSNKINLEFSVDTKESFENSLFKLDTLLNGIRKFRSAIVKAREIKIEYEKNTKKLQKPKNINA